VETVGKSCLTQSHEQYAGCPRAIAGVSARLAVNARARDHRWELPVTRSWPREGYFR
jgi:hypothetical protein